jgi:hypothetical protein
MKHALSLDRAKIIIQGWYNQFCKEYGKPAVTLEIKEEEHAGARAYKVLNNVSGCSTAIPLLFLAHFFLPHGHSINQAKEF